jgi:hypothetical protein
MTNNNKAIAIVGGAIVAVFAVSLLLRFIVLSEYGVPGAWIYFGLPIGGIGVPVLLLRLGLLNFGEGGAILPWQHHSSVQAAPVASAPPAPSASQRLQELETLRASGGISDSEYTATRQQIISGM